MTNPTDILSEILAAQPKAKRYANTLTALIGLGVTVIWTLISLGVDVPTDVTTGVAVAISALTALGVKFTPNGVTEKQIEEVREYAGRHRA